MKLFAFVSIWLVTTVTHAVTPSPNSPIPLPTHREPRCLAALEKARELAEEHRREQGGIERTCESMVDCDERIREWRSTKRSEEEVASILKALDCSTTAEVFPVEFSLQLLRTISRGVHDERIAETLYHMLSSLDSKLHLVEIRHLRSKILYAMGFNGTQIDRERLIEFTSPEYWEQWFEERNISFRDDEDVRGGIVVAIRAIGQLPLALASEALQEVERRFSVRDKKFPSEDNEKFNATIQRSLSTTKDDLKLREEGKPPTISGHRKFFYLPKE